jgi:hypothetical protein
VLSTYTDTRVQVGKETRDGTLAPLHAYPPPFALPKEIEVGHDAIGGRSSGRGRRANDKDRRNATGKPGPRQGMPIEKTHTSRIILDGGQLGTRPNTLRGIEEAGLRGRDEADDERAVRVDVRLE